MTTEGLFCCRVFSATGCGCRCCGWSWGMAASAWPGGVQTRSRQGLPGPARSVVPREGVEGRRGSRGCRSRATASPRGLRARSAQRVTTRQVTTRQVTTRHDSQERAPGLFEERGGCVRLGPSADSGTDGVCRDPRVPRAAAAPAATSSVLRFVKVPPWAPASSRRWQPQSQPRRAARRQALHACTPKSRLFA